ncbi:MAG: cation:proton antiporter [Clostridia bacterium]|nr:cation:proton antiporter [Clostridia bacterium]
MTTMLGLVLAMVAGLLMTRIMKLFNLPNVTGYLVAGIIVGPYCCNFVNATSLAEISFISTVALGFIAFSIGGEFKLSTIKAIGGKVIVIAIIQAIGAVFMVMGGLFILRAINPDLISVPSILVLSAISAATAPAATLMVVKQFKAKGPVTETLLPVVAFDDAIALMVFAVCFGLAKSLTSGAEISAISVVVRPLLEIVVSLAIGGAIGFVLSVVCRFFRSRANRLGWMIACVLAGVGICELLELSSLLTCMMTGAVFCNMREDSVKILDGSERWTPPLFMLFFVISGATLDLAVIPQVGLVGIVYLVCRSIGKYAGAYGSALLMKTDKNVRNYLGITLLPQAGVAIGMATIVANTEGFDEVAKSVVTVVLCATLIYELIGPVLTKWALAKAGEIDPKMSSIPIVEMFKKAKQKKNV